MNLLVLVLHIHVYVDKVYIAYHALHLKMLFVVQVNEEKYSPTKQMMLHVYVLTITKEVLCNNLQSAFILMS